MVTQSHADEVDPSLQQIGLQIETTNDDVVPTTMLLLLLLASILIARDLALLWMLLPLGAIPQALHSYLPGCICAAEHLFAGSLQHYFRGPCIKTRG